MINSWSDLSAITARLNVTEVSALSLLFFLIKKSMIDGYVIPFFLAHKKVYFLAPLSSYFLAPSALFFLLFLLTFLPICRWVCFETLDQMEIHLFLLLNAFFFFQVKPATDEFTKEK